MPGIGRRYRAARARRQYMPGPRIGGPGLLPWVALAVIVSTMVVVNRLGQSERERDAGRLERVRAVMDDPVQIVATAARTNRLVILGDVLGAEAPKRLAADVIEALARGPGLDVVALEVDGDMQASIDAYLEAREEDASLLLSRPRATREWEGFGRTFLEIYRRVRTMNAELGAARRIRVLAIDAPGWPPSPPPSPARMAQRFGERSEHMARVLEERILEHDERARVLVLVDGLHTLRGRMRIETGGEVLDSVPLLATRLEMRSGIHPFTTLVEAPVTAAPALGFAGYRPGRLFESLGPASPDRAFGFAVSPGLPIGLDELGLWRVPGVIVEITESPLLVDAWVRLPG